MLLLLADSNPAPTGKLNHSGSDQLSRSLYSLVDYNRAGQALLEVVSEPDMRSGQDAAAYGAEIRRIMVFLGVSDGEMSVSVPVPKINYVKCHMCQMSHA